VGVGVVDPVRVVVGELLDVPVSVGVNVLEAVGEAVCEDDAVAVDDEVSDGVWVELGVQLGVGVVVTPGDE
jgi:hypothetical protein